MVEIEQVEEVPAPPIAAVAETAIDAVASVFYYHSLMGLYCTQSPMDIKSTMLQNCRSKTSANGEYEAMVATVNETVTNLDLDIIVIKMTETDVKEQIELDRDVPEFWNETHQDTQSISSIRKLKSLPTIAGCERVKLRNLVVFKGKISIENWIGARRDDFYENGVLMRRILFYPGGRPEADFLRETPFKLRSNSGELCKYLPLKCSCGYDYISREQNCLYRVGCWQQNGDAVFEIVKDDQNNLQVIKNGGERVYRFEIGTDADTVKISTYSNQKGVIRNIGFDQYVWIGSEYRRAGICWERDGYSLVIQKWDAANNRMCDADGITIGEIDPKDLPSAKTNLIAAATGTGASGAVGDIC